ncbi:Tol biopolymer transport system component [Dyadobacter jejuensis]|uniref:Tol biopolymer transport system component n=1 Tax=Dyadobacter jejuensis TaxID=1082580 RepID=A0A316AAM5_9BACT|nr:DPP IV N-terminal domain-containing protein [Dyadobacter jejuensis]PWJ54743.1 Tol biopolymer transport system component [Dyadobacter jejuensis]
MFKRYLASLLCVFIYLPSLQAQTYLTDSVRVRLSEGTNMAAALSPDKSTIAIDLQGTIYLVPVGGGTGMAITDALGDCRLPTWSPDGERIAFQSYRDGNYHIWEVNRNGTQLRQLTFGVFHDREPDYSPDGKKIIFSSDRSGNYDLWTVDVTNNNLNRLTTGLENEYYPSYSADGSSIVYVSENKSQPGLYRLDGESAPKLIYETKEKVHSPVWNATGSQILFTKATHQWSTLEALDVSTRQTTLLTDSLVDIFPFKVSWLTDTDYLYTGQGKLWKGSLANSEKDSIPFEVNLSLGRHRYTPKQRSFDLSVSFKVQGIRSPVVSPDGQKVVFTALGDLWVLTIGQALPVRITQGPHVKLDPVWSPDGKLITYTSDKNGGMDIWSVDLKSKKEAVLIQAESLLKFPSWSPDGRYLAYYQAQANSYSKYSLQLWDKTTGQSRAIEADFFEGSQPTWFPDSKSIAISAVDPFSTRFREGLNKVHIYGIDGTFKNKFSPVADKSLGTRGKNGPFVSPDGSKMAYIQDNLLWMVPLSSQQEVAGPPVCLSSELAESPSWSGDSQQILFLSSDLLKRVDVVKGTLEAIPFDLEWKAKGSDQLMVVHAGRVFDGKNEKYLLNQDLVIKGNRIEGIYPHQEGRAGQYIDASMLTVMPGMFEMHTHQSAYLGEKGGRLWLAYGVTSIREPGTDPYDALERKEAWGSGARLGPRTFFTGGHMEGNRVYYNRNTSNVGGSQLDLELNRAATLGYDMIKTYVGLSDMLQKRVTDFAHQNGMSVSSHELYPAAGYGVDAVEHMGATSRRGFSPKLTALNHSYQDFITIIAKSGMYITPTISLHGGFFAQVLSDTSFFNHDQFKLFYPERLGKQLAATSRAMQSRLVTYPHVESTLKTLINSGARVTPGTDSPILPSGLSYHAELRSWVKAGVSNFQTLRAATLWSAEEIGVSKDLGTIEAGKLADMVLIDGDPLVHIEDLINVKGVFKNGTYLSEERLRHP